MKRFKMAPEIFYEEGAVNYLYDLDFKSAFIITDQTMNAIGLAGKVTDILKEINIDYECFSDVEPDPSIETVHKALDCYFRTDAEVLIAIGGGSVIDAAKAVIYYLKEARAKKYGKREKPFFVAIPTTSGTGSEVTSYTVLTDTVTNTKIPLKDDDMFPDVAILDCEFTKTVPPKVTAETGMDVLTHAIESFVSVMSSDYTAAFAQISIEYVFKYLVNCYTNGLDNYAREKIHNASCMAGMAFENSALGINHSLAHAIGAKFHLSHGSANAVLLPYVIKYNSGLFDHNYDVSFDTAVKYQKIARLTGLPAADMKEAVIMLMKSIRILNMKLNIPLTIKAMDIAEEIFMPQVNEITRNAMQDLCTSGNPRVPSETELRQVLIDAYTGDIF